MEIIQIRNDNWWEKSSTKIQFRLIQKAFYIDGYYFFFETLPKKSVLLSSMTIDMQKH